MARSTTASPNSQIALSLSILWPGSKLSLIGCLQNKTQMKGGGCIGVPVYFFFNLASANLADNAQLINLDAIAELAKEWQLTVRVTGAADSATGSADGNASLSQSRADHISRMLQEKGVPGEKIQTVAEGGIEKFSPPDVNRQCKVELIF